MRSRSALSTCLALAACLAAAPAARGIVGGGPAPDEAAGSVVMVLGEGGGVCSGVVLSRQAILTAAHCVTRAKRHRVFWPRAGEDPLLIEPATIAVHPGFDPKAVQRRTRSIDLAVVRLAAPLPAGVRPARLAQAVPRAGEALTIIGFGVARERDGRTAGTLRAAALTVVEPYGPSTILLWARGAAGNGAKGTGACEGDSGGPVLDAAGAVTAVTTWSTGPGKARCGDLTQGAFIAPQRDWIHRAAGL
jgi:hypothetical protein